MEGVNSFHMFKRPSQIYMHKENTHKHSKNPKLLTITVTPPQIEDVEMDALEEFDIYDDCPICGPVPHYVKGLLALLDTPGNHRKTELSPLQVPKSPGHMKVICHNRNKNVPNNHWIFKHSNNNNQSKTQVLNDMTLENLPYGQLVVPTATDASFTTTFKRSLSDDDLLHFSKKFCQEEVSIELLVDFILLLYFLNIEGCWKMPY